MSNEKPDLMVPPDVAHAMVRERDYREGYAAGMAEGAAAERARLVAVVTKCVRVHRVGLNWISLGEALEAMGLSEEEIAEAMGAEEGSGQ